MKLKHHYFDIVVTLIIVLLNFTWVVYDGCQYLMYGDKVSLFPSIVSLACSVFALIIISTVNLIKVLKELRKLEKIFENMNDKSSKVPEFWGGKK